MDGHSMENHSAMNGNIQSDTKVTDDTNHGECEHNSAATNGNGVHFVTKPNGRSHSSSIDDVVIENQLTDRLGLVKTAAADDREEADDEDNKDLPIDRGWAWVILLAALLAHFIIVGQLKCFGIFFVQYQRRFGSTSSETSLIFTVMNATYSVAALLNLTIGSSIPTRLSMTIGCVINCVGSLTTGLIYDARLACLTYGASVGLANAFIMPQVSTTVSYYFVKKRGFANNTMNTGVGMGALALAPLLTVLFEHYGYTSTFILILGLNLQILVITCLVRPISFYRRRKKVKSINKDVAIEEEAVELLPAKNASSEDDIPNKGNTFQGEIQDDKNGSKPTGASDYMRKRYFSESDKLSHNNGKTSTLLQRSVMNSMTSRFASTDVINSSLMDLTIIQENDNSVSKTDGQSSGQEDVNSKTCGSVVRKLFAKLFDVKLLSNPVFHYYLLCNALLCSGNGMATAFLPAHAIELGVSEEMASLLISVPSILDIASKFMFGFVSDKGWCHRSTLIALASMVLGVAAQFMFLMTTFSTIMMYAVLSGLLQGVYFALFVVVIIDILTMDNLKGALGFISLVQGITGGLCLPVAGYLRDYSGSYNYTFSFIGCTLILGAILCYFLPNVHAWHENKLKQLEKRNNKV